MFEGVQKANRNMFKQDFNEILFISIRDAILYALYENESSTL